MMLIARTLDLSPSLISNTRSTRFWSSWTIFGSTVAAKRPWRLYSSMIRSTSARTFERVKIWRGASLISGRILSSLMPLVALEDDAVDDRVLAHRDDQIAGVGAGDDDVGEQFGRVEVLQRRIERLGGIGLAGREVGVGADRLGLEALGAAHRDRLGSMPELRGRGGRRRRPAPARGGRSGWRRRCCPAPAAAPPSRRGSCRPGACAPARLPIMLGCWKSRVPA